MRFDWLLCYVTTEKQKKSNTKTRQIWQEISIENDEKQADEECDPETNLVEEEKWYIVAFQVFVPFMIAGFGMVAAGLVLERVKVRNLIVCLSKKKSSFGEFLRNYHYSKQWQRFIFWCQRC